MGTRSTGLGVPPGNGGGLQSGQLSARRQVSAAPGWDLGFAIGGSYLSQGTISGDVPSRGLATSFTAHYAAKMDGGLGFGAYGQAGGAAQQTGRDSWSEARFVSVTPAIAWEPEGSVVNSIAVNPGVFSFTNSGQLSQGPVVKNLIGAGISVGAGFNATERRVIMPEVSWIHSSGAATRPGDPAAHSDTFRIGFVTTLSYRGPESTQPTRSIAIGLWYFQEDGSVSGASASGAADGRFATRGCLLGATFGLRRSTLLGLQ
jgi:hypothetical protein